ncbi:MAG: phage gp6-like head-tail connector protein [Oscillibacter sp.]|nr:phage gp6-like head-tail connector protein [Oscillibacter sp.]
MEAVRRAALLAYCRIDALEPEDDLLLDSLYLSAVSYMEQAGILEPPENTGRRAQYDLCVNALVLDAWDNRGTRVDARISENMGFRQCFNQLKLTEPDAFTSREG